MTIYSPMELTQGNTVRFAFKQMCKRINTQLAVDLLSASDFEISKAAVDPAMYSCAKVFSNDYLLVSYLKKFKGLSTGVDTKAVALSSFAAAELQCKMTNERFRRHNTSLVDPIIHRAQRKIAKLLGVFNLDILSGGERWGPGATFEFSRRSAYLDTKIAKLPFSVTASAYSFFKKAIQSDLHWSAAILGTIPEGDYSLLSSCFQIVTGSRIDTVDKNAVTDRTIAIEPRGNMFLQKSIGNFIRKRLKTVGVDLNDQSINQDLARFALDLDLATIDLSMASDTMSIGLVAELLPFEWYDYIDRIRSSRYTLDGINFQTFEKCSSMGNGFTFELESLIFWALTSSVNDAFLEREGVNPEIHRVRTCAVYGDDIICPVSIARELICVLNWAGFDINESKSFIEGPFRESCGRHYFDGVDVTPIYQKEEVLCVESHIRFFNRITRLAVKRHIGGVLLEPMVLGPLRKKLYSRIRSVPHPQLPMGADGDDGYLVSSVEAGVLRPGPDGSFFFPVVRRLLSRLPANEDALYAYSLRLNASRPIGPSWNSPLELIPFDGSIATRNIDSCPLERGRRWIRPSREFALA